MFAVDIRTQVESLIDSGLSYEEILEEADIHHWGIERTRQAIRDYINDYGDAAIDIDEKTKRANYMDTYFRIR